MIEDDPSILAALTNPSYRARPERVIRFHVKAWDVNCRQHIPRLVSEAVDRVDVQERGHRMAALESEKAMVRRQLSRQLVESLAT